MKALAWIGFFVLYGLSYAGCLSLHEWDKTVSHIAILILGMVYITLYRWMVKQSNLPSHV